MSVTTTTNKSSNSYKSSPTLSDKAQSAIISYRLPYNISFVAIIFVCNEIYWQELAHAHTF